MNRPRPFIPATATALVRGRANCGETGFGRTMSSTIGCRSALVALFAAVAGCSSGLSDPNRLDGADDLVVQGAGQVERVFNSVDASPLRITVISRDVDVRVSLFDADGGILAQADAPNRRQGVETLFVESPSGVRPEQFKLRIEGVDHRAARGHASFTVDRLPLLSASDRRRLDAVRADALAAAAYVRVDRTADAAEAYLRAASDHVRNRDRHSAGLSKLNAAGVYYWRLSNWELAAKLSSSAFRDLIDSDPFSAAFAQQLEGAALSEMAQGTAEKAPRRELFALARARLTAAANRFEGLSRTYEAGYALNYRGISFHMDGERGHAATDYRRAFALFEAAGDAPAQALSLQSLAQLQSEDGRLTEALRAYDAALKLLPRTEQPANYAHTLSNSASPLVQLGRFEEAARRYHEAARILRSERDPLGEARALHGIGIVLQHSGEPTRAREMLEAAVRLREGAGAAREQSISLVALGRIERALGRYDLAIDLHRRAARLVSAPHDRARVMLALAQDYAAVGRLDEARTVLMEVITLDLPSTNRHLGNAWSELGEVESRANRREAALDAHDRAVAIHRANGADVDLARAHFGRAKAQRRGGDLDAVLADTTAAIDRFEQIGLQGVRGEARAVFLAVQRDVAELRIGALLDLAVADVARGAVSEARQRLRMALDASDRVRGRLLDESATRDPTMREGSAARQGRNELYERLAGLRARREKLSESARQDPAELGRLTQEIEMLRLQVARPDRGAISSRREVDGLENGRTLNVADGLMLVEFYLGRERSWRFDIHADAINVHELASGDVVENAARALHANWRRPPVDERTDRLSERLELARLLWTGLDPPSVLRELVVVPDGALHLVPMALLAPLDTPERRSPGLVAAPSLRAWFRPDRTPTKATQLLAVIADPVFSADDPRVRAAVTAAAATGVGVTAVVAPGAVSPDSAQDGSLQRLPGTAHEARAILELVADKAGRLALTGTDATRDRVEGDRLADYRILHFATHAWADREDPGLAALALSAWGKDGVPLDGTLRLHEIASATLNADLVVLSACETGLGREIRGEGPVGLSQAFLSAGARAVLATLWRVPDGSTATLMSEFYRQHLLNGQDPPAALRLAQAAVRSQSKWSDPYYWAGFQLTETSGNRP